MKKSVLCLFVLMLTAMSSAQDTQVKENYFNVDFYFGVGMLYTDALDINPFLSESNVPTVRRFPFEFSFGLFGDFGKNKVELDFGFYNQDRESNNFGHELSSGSITLRYLRQIIQFKNEHKLYAGLGINYMTSELEFFDESETIDLDEPGGFGDVAKLDLYQFHVGPSLGYSVFSSDDDGEFLRLQLSYDINVSNIDWDSDYALVSNSIDETGNRLRLQLIFPF